RARLVQLILLNPLRDFAGEAAGQRNQAVLVRGEQFLVYARFVIIAGEMRLGGELNEIFVASRVLRQQTEMVINVTSSAAGFLFQPAARRDIRFAADDGFDAFLAGGLVKINRAVEHAVVGDGERGKF